MKSKATGVERVTDRARILHTYMDEGRRGVRVTLYELAAPLKGGGFVAEAADSQGRTLVRRAFLLTDEGLEAQDDAGERRLTRSPETLHHLGGVGAVVAVLVVALFLQACAPGSRSSTTQSGQAVASKSCDPITPSELPRGSAPGDAVRSEEDGIPYVTWGQGEERVTQAVGVVVVGAPEDADIPEQHPQRVTVRGHEALVMPIGDPPLGEISISWGEASCAYTVWIESGYTLDEAISYAGRY